MHTVNLSVPVFNCIIIAGQEQGITLMPSCSDNRNAFPRMKHWRQWLMFCIQGERAPKQIYVKSLDSSDYCQDFFVTLHGRIQDFEMGGEFL